MTLPADDLPARRSLELLCELIRFVGKATEQERQHLGGGRDGFVNRAWIEILLHGAEQLSSAVGFEDKCRAWNAALEEFNPLKNNAAPPHTETKVA